MDAALFPLIKQEPDSDNEADPLALNIDPCKVKVGSVNRFLFITGYVVTEYCFLSYCVLIWYIQSLGFSAVKVCVCALKEFNTL
jgi:hypothetical protein